MRAAMFAFAVWRVAVKDSGRRGAAMGPLIAQINPEPAGLGLAVARSENGDGRVIGMDDAAWP